MTNQPFFTKEHDAFIPTTVANGPWDPNSLHGRVIIGLLENAAHFVDSQYLHWGNLYEIAPFYVLIVILMIKPYGLFGTQDIERI